VGDAAAAQPLAGEEAGDAPVRQGDEVLLVPSPALDLRQLRGGTELAPAHAGVAVKHQRGVRAALADPLLLVGPVLHPGAPLADLDVEAHAPAAAPHAVVRLNQSRERRPGVHIQGPHGERDDRLACCRQVAHGNLHNIDFRTTGTTGLELDRNRRTIASPDAISMDHRRPGPTPGSPLQRQPTSGPAEQLAV